LDEFFVKFRRAMTDNAHFRRELRKFEVQLLEEASKPRMEDSRIDLQ
jgi:hypothetical protein